MPIAWAATQTAENSIREPDREGPPQPGNMRRIGVLMGYEEGVAEAQAWVAASKLPLQLSPCSRS